MSHIEICGGIASGKTTLASLFGQNNPTPLYEDFKKSPFWKKFYLNPGKYIFETEISFVLLHYHQIKSALEQNQSNLICDYSFFIDLAYAKIGLSGSQLKAFECVLNEIRHELPDPDLYIYLECDAETQLERIKNRKRTEERLINIEFLQSLDDALEFEIGKIDKAKVIKINSAKNDFVNNELVKSEMIALIKASIPA